MRRNKRVVGCFIIILMWFVILLCPSVARDSMGNCVPFQTLELALDVEIMC